jgi:trehalose/maltose transport system substrate-binding protein
MTILWSSTAARRTLGLCLSAALMASCKAPDPPVTLIYPHGSSFRSDYLTRGVALSQEFTRTTGIPISDVPVPEGTREQFSFFRGLLQRAPAGLDLFETDVIWPRLLESDLTDLRSQLGEEIGLVAPDLLASYTIGEKVVGIPYDVYIGSLEYRSDLLHEYGYDHPPRTWDELEIMARRIQDGERAKGRTDFWGFVWQGAEAESLTCNALEWQFAEGGGRIVEDDRTVSVNNPAAIRSWERAKGWIGSISPPAVAAYRERDSMGVFDAGNAAFNRLWLGASNARSVPFSEVRWRNGESRVRSGFTRLPSGRRAQAGTLGGSGLAVSHRSAHPREALKMVQFLIKSRVESLERRRNDSNKDRFYVQPDTERADGSPELPAVVHRPSIETGSHYTQVSARYAAAVHSVLTGEQTAPAAAAALERELVTLTGYRWGAPKNPQ